MSENDEPRVTVQPDGPYLVFGHVPLASREVIVSEKGDKLSWTTAEAKDRPGSPYALCRCGRTANSPFCDGSHARVGFDGKETAPTNTAAERFERYEGEGMTLLDDKPVCIHAGFCGAGGKYIWSLMEETEDTGIRALAMAMTERCPSGRLLYEVPGEETPVEPSMPVQAAIVPGGPIWLTGGVPVERSDGESCETRDRVTLCRCGASKNKPLCDGSHSEIGFEAE